MTWRKAAVVAASIALAASMTAGCQAPQASKPAVSFQGVSYTEGQVAEATNELNGLLPAETIQQMFGSTKLSRIQTINLLLFTPTVNKVKGDDPELEQQVDALVVAMRQQAGSQAKAGNTTREALRNLLAVTSDPTQQIAQKFQSDIAQAAPIVSQRYGIVDASTGNAMMPRVPDVVAFKGHAQQAR